MIPAEVDYVQVNCLQEALALKSKHLDEAQILAGGHSLIPLLKLRMAAPTLLVDVQRVEELNGIYFEKDVIRIGALTRHSNLLKHDDLHKEWPIFRQTAQVIADPQVRNRGTIGGSLCTADPSADWPAVVQALDAELHLCSVEGERIVKASDFFIGMMETDLKDGEILTEITIPRNKRNLIMSYQKYRHPASGYAVASAAVVLSVSGEVIEDCSIALSGVADRAFIAEKTCDLLRGNTPTTEILQNALDHLVEGQDILTDHFADDEYRTQLAKIMAKRALEDCLKA
ncbi:xanthine dehydrogenase family protein subunit M [Sneathiella sp. P13V-1]|uniref:FAD binding domain-containing protein n=1 Tax=Sneathiella sp. P13V-1 TaxID=2697366 RepID=UPI00187B9114|nr:xanthine dehydrogenase family protein subunit M [Sneathiella sp. P13V-1]MBE7637735.1 xanthine dehydrogenase family protein subunit M [Sneathiella sp. P13V-1]